MASVKKFIFIAGGIPVIFTAAFLIFSGKVEQFIAQRENKSFQENIQQTIGQKVVLVIENGGESPKTIESEFQDKMTAFDLLKNSLEKENIILETKQYDFGILIEAIGGVKNGDGGKYWLYYVNGEMPPVSADQKELKVGDKVEFKFEKSSF
ncbi:MAG: DUF4430 domain-containing protein [Patescibacteria group bacterium]